ncbi:MAG: hypothetical protein IKU17_04410, partial [Clostridia bacterium]|nr:hypothetical protein [Clostridia bacterium]
KLFVAVDKDAFADSVVTWRGCSAGYRTMALQNIAATEEILKGSELCFRYRTQRITGDEFHPYLLQVFLDPKDSDAEAVEYQLSENAFVLLIYTDQWEQDIHYSRGYRKE